MTDTALLREAVTRSGLKYKKIAESLGLTTYGLQKKIENKTEFKASEILLLSELLNLTERERNAIFFAKKSDYKSHSEEDI